MSILDYISSPAGGSITGYRTINEKGFVNVATESIWIAVFVFFIFYELLMLFHPLSKFKLEIKPAKESKNQPIEQVSQSSSGGVTPVESSEENTFQEMELHSSEIYDSITRIGCAFRDSYLILLGTALVGMSGYGLYGTSLTLAWILFAILLIWSFSQLIALTLLAGLIELTSIFVGMVLVIILWGMAYYKSEISGFN